MKNMAVKVVIDTNALVSSLSSKSAFHKLIRLILEEDINMFVTDEILFEYEEVLHKKYSESVAQSFLSALKEIPTVQFVNIYFKWNLLTQDEDDNKFVDAFIACGANYLVTEDKHFELLNNITFPLVNIISLSTFGKLINNSIPEDVGL